MSDGVSITIIICLTLILLAIITKHDDNDDE